MERCRTALRACPPPAAPGAEPGPESGAPRPGSSNHSTSTPRSYGAAGHAAAHPHAPDRSTTGTPSPATTRSSAPPTSPPGSTTHARWRGQRSPVTPPAARTPPHPTGTPHPSPQRSPRTPSQDDGGQVNEYKRCGHRPRRVQLVEVEVEVEVDPRLDCLTGQRYSASHWSPCRVRMAVGPATGLKLTGHSVGDRAVFPVRGRRRSHCLDTDGSGSGPDGFARYRLPQELAGPPACTPPTPPPPAQCSPRAGRSWCWS
ncbi:hypothetical protein Ae406Ps2_6445 [Pseudonocardia sp. Ae406_Ps2]|nr:hypothetical protein Ae406Ps2_6445 [Pseudonocardia sp. Ae406_Ps2]